MKSEVLVHFPYMSLVVAGQVIFFLVFVGALAWIFRKGARQFYQELAKLPLEQKGESHD